jgi:hypothetical protein
MKYLAYGWVCGNFPRKFHFFLGAIHEKRKFKYFKNLMVKVCKIWCNYVYMYILLIDIHIYFWLKGNILALIHLGVLLLNNYEISGIYEYHVWR